MNCSTHQALFELPNQAALDGRGVWSVLERGQMHTGDSCVSLENFGINGTIFLKYICKGWDRSAWTGLIWLRVRASGEHLCSR